MFKMGEKIGQGNKQEVFDKLSLLEGDKPGFDIQFTLPQEQKIKQMIECLPGNSLVKNLVELTVKNPEEARRILKPLQQFAQASALDKVKMQLRENLARKSMVVPTLSPEAYVQRTLGGVTLGSANFSDTGDRDISELLLYNSVEDFFVAGNSEVTPSAMALGNLLDQLVWLSEWQIVKEKILECTTIANKLFASLLADFPKQKAPIRFYINLNTSSPNTRASNVSTQGEQLIHFRLTPQDTAELLSNEELSIQKVILLIAEWMHEVSHSFIDSFLQDLPAYKEAMKVKDGDSVLSALHEALPVQITLLVLLQFREMLRQAKLDQFLDLADKQLKLVYKQYSDLQVFGAGYTVAKNLKKLDISSTLEAVRKLDFMKLAKTKIDSAEGQRYLKDPLSV